MLFLHTKFVPKKKHFLPAGPKTYLDVSGNQTFFFSGVLRPSQQRGHVEPVS